MDISNNVSFFPQIIVKNSLAMLNYSGNLCNSNRLFIEYTYKNLENNSVTVNTHEMIKSQNGFFLLIHIGNHDEMYFKFKNENNEIDNNNNKDYFVEIKNVVIESDNNTTNQDSNNNTSINTESVENNPIQSSNNSISSENFDIENTDTNSLNVNEFDIQDFDELLEDDDLDEFSSDEKNDNNISNFDNSYKNDENPISHTTTTNTTTPSNSLAMIPLRDRGLLNARQGLRLSYRINKKIRLALYKIFRNLPTFITGNYRRRINL